MKEYIIINKTNIEKRIEDLKNNNLLEGYNSPTEAYEAAIEYCLNNVL
jgi:hypothetical protein